MIEVSIHKGDLTYYLCAEHDAVQEGTEAKEVKEASSMGQEQIAPQEEPQEELASISQLILQPPSPELSLKNFEPRLYQQTILATATQKNTLVVLPTGLGKTSIALMLALHRLKQLPNQKILFLAPTKPLVDQHQQSFLHYSTLDPKKLAVFTGHVPPQKRAELWKQAQVVFSTPQGLENDLINGSINPQEISLLIFDEAHRATGDYAYTFIAKQYLKKATYPKILGLTASPGSDMEKIMEIFENLGIEDLEIRTHNDPDVRPYIQPIHVKWVDVFLPDEFKAIQLLLKRCYLNKLQEIAACGYLNKEHLATLSKTELLRLQGDLHREIGQGNKDFTVLKSISLTAEAFKVQHGLELLETQGLTALNLYLNGLQEQAVSSKVKAVKNLVVDEYFKTAYAKTQALVQTGVEHPKIPKLKELLTKALTDTTAKTKKIIIFNQYRDMAAKIVEEINTLGHVSARLFVGQAKKRGQGLSQKKQKAMLDEFRNHDFNVLVATSVAEEGLDIPHVDLVIFYEPIPSEIRHIQRRGRTGRLEKGAVLILMAKGTRDEAYRWSAYNKEKRMYRHLDELKKKFMLLTKKQDVHANYLNSADHTLQGDRSCSQSCSQSSSGKIAPDIPIMILADDREKGSGIVKELFDVGASVRLKRLALGDYMLSSQCVVELKTVPDFVDSIIDGRILSQARELKEKFEHPILIMQGDEDLYSQRKIHPNAIRGVLATLTVTFGLSVLYTKNAKDTASLLAIIAKREQQEPGNEFAYHTVKPLTLKERQEFLVSALPGIGSALSKPLLEHFGSIKNLMNADLAELQKVEKIGEKKARKIQQLLQAHYASSG
ncbi:TPA: DEAD/DEAH box helicase family protein [Candidatus Woesearchaeota archaeon]|nr:MAG: fanconi anemia group M protein [archaeon GW2011_AR16]HIG96387.1 DEAD/DEAH box helicase family protein [Candidatus Woesearchaeota archaeon]